MEQKILCFPAECRAKHANLNVAFVCIYACVCVYISELIYEQLT